MDKPTRGSVDALYAKGLTIKQIAGIYRCSEGKIARIKSRNSHGIWCGDRVTMNPIKPVEIEAARQVETGYKVRVFNIRKTGDGISWGVWEDSGVAVKYPHIAVLDNGMAVNYAEIAMQMRAKEEMGCL